MTHSILILGGGDIGSAVAHRLFLLGTAPILHDINAPAHPRRGMAFTDAWFAGTATLEGVAAFRSGSVEAIRDLREDIHALPVTSVAVAPLVEAFSFAAVVDARMRKREVPADIRSLAALTIGLGPGFSPNRNCHIAIETAWGDALGTVLYNQESRALAGEPRPIGAVGRERFVYSPCAGLWRTDCHIGQKVTANEVVGSVDATPVCAPLAGTIRGLPHDSVEVKQRQKIVEIDPRNPAEVFGLGERPRAIARGVSAALDLGTGLEDALYQFEWEYRAKLDCIPMC